MIHHRLWIKRLLRRIKYVFTDSTLFTWEYESCKHCGRCFRICWSAKNEIWEKVIGVTDGSGGSLCLDCFINKAEKMGICISEEDIERIDLFLPGQKDNIFHY